MLMRFLNPVAILCHTANESLDFWFTQLFVQHVGIYNNCDIYTVYILNNYKSIISNARFCCVNFYIFQNHNRILYRYLLFYRYTLNNQHFTKKLLFNYFLSKNAHFILSYHLEHVFFYVHHNVIEITMHMCVFLFVR